MTLTSYFKDNFGTLKIHCSTVSWPPLTPWEAGPHSYCCVPHIMCLYYYLWLLSRSVSLTLVFSSLIMMELDVVFFVPMSLLNFWICELIYSTKFGKFSAIISQNIFSFCLLPLFLQLLGLKLHIC